MAKKDVMMSPSLQDWTENGQDEERIAVYFQSVKCFDAVTDTCDEHQAQGGKGAQTKLSSTDRRAPAPFRLEIQGAWAL